MKLYSLFCSVVLQTISSCSILHFFLFCVLLFWCVIWIFYKKKIKKNYGNFIVQEKDMIGNKSYRSVCMVCYVGREKNSTKSKINFACSEKLWSVSLMMKYNIFFMEIFKMILITYGSLQKTRQKESRMKRKRNQQGKMCLSQWMMM